MTTAKGHKYNLISTNVSFMTDVFRSKTAIKWISFYKYIFINNTANIVYCY